MYTPFKMKGKSPMMKKLIGNQHRLPEHLKAKIMAAPESPAKKRVKVKDMPRKQQMAVKATMADGGKGAPTKMMKKSPAKAMSKAAKNLLKAVPNKAAYDKLSPEDRKGFDKAAKKAGLPTKSVAKMKKSAMKLKKSPAKNKPKTKMLKGTTVFGKEVNKKNIKRAVAAYLTGGLSETKIGKKAIKKTKKVVKKAMKGFKSVPVEAMGTGVGRAAKERVRKAKAVKAAGKGAIAGATGGVKAKPSVKKKSIKKVGTKDRLTAQKVVGKATPGKPAKKATRKLVKKVGGVSKGRYVKDHTGREKLKDQFSDRTLIGNARARQERNKKKFQKKF
jgi:hypothetical protein